MLWAYSPCLRELHEFTWRFWAHPCYIILWHTSLGNLSQRNTLTSHEVDLPREVRLHVSVDSAVQLHVSAAAISVCRLR